MSDSSSRLNFIRVSRHTLNQLKFVIPGAAITYYLGLQEVFLRIVADTDGPHRWGRRVVFLVRNCKLRLSLTGAFDTGLWHLSRWVLE
jgi:hypothetical protein